MSGPVGGVPRTPPKLRTKHPADRYTTGTKLWIGLGISSSALELYALIYDKRNPGNREKWTLTSNARTLGGFDSITGEPIAVPFGTLRRTALLLSLYWVVHHWTNKRGTY